MDAKRTMERLKRAARPLGALVAACAAAVGSMATFAAADATAAQQPHIAVGDSVTAGWGASSPSKNFVGRLYADYQSSLGSNQLLNLGVPGETSSTMISNGQLASALADVNAPTDTRALTVGIGANDGYLGSCSGHWSEPSVCPFKANFAQILTKLRAALANDPGPESFEAMTYYNPYTGLGTPAEVQWNTMLFGANLKVGCNDSGANVGLTDLIDQEAGKLNVPVANPYPAFKQAGQSFISSDHLHPNDAGYAAIAQSFRDAAVPCHPQTTFTAGPVSGVTHDRTPTFGFRSSEPGSTFECSLDGHAFTPCDSPVTTPTLSFGSHAFRVRAKDHAGNIDLTPALAAFKVVR